MDSSIDDFANYVQHKKSPSSPHKKRHTLRSLEEKRSPQRKDNNSESKDFCPSSPFKRNELL
jgi:hypothetical protein